jgi:copper homeostasis protein
MLRAGLAGDCHSRVRRSRDLERHGSRSATGAGTILIEAAVESLESALAAEANGADRLELCANLRNGGTTPNLKLIAAVLDKTQLPVVVMIRPHGGDFVYSDDEIAAMKHDIADAKKMGISGIVTGILTDDAGVDIERTRILVSAAAGLPVTFHRAFDSTQDLPRALEQLKEVGVSRILTSGGAATALEGASVISALVSQARNRIAIIAGGGVRDHNVRELVDRTGISEVHARQVRGIRRALTG